MKILAVGWIKSWTKQTQSVSPTILRMSSPGIGRDLVLFPGTLSCYLGEQIEVKLIRPMQLENGSSLREFVAPLCSCDDQTITVELDGQQLTIEKKDAAYIRLYEQISFK